MQTRRLGNSDLQISRLGFGAWAIGGGGWQFGWGDQDDRSSISAIHKALELGINWIDTAAVYGLGHSEEVIARALKDWRGLRPYVFTKCGMVWNQDREVDKCLRAASLRKECEESLRRLCVDAIDLYQIHWPADNLTETEDGWSTLQELRDEGKVRWIGVSNFNREEIQRAQAIAQVTSLQPPYSLIRRDIEKEQLSFCEAHGIGVLVYSPMASGLLTGAMSRDRAAALPADDWRSRNADFKEPNLSRHLDLVQRLKAVAKRHGSSAGQAAIAWTLRNRAVTAAIVGARSAAQVESLAGAADLKLSDAEAEEIEGSQ